MHSHVKAADRQNHTYRACAEGEDGGGMKGIGGIVRSKGEGNFTLSCAMAVPGVCISYRWRAIGQRTPIPFRYYPEDT